MIGINGEVEFLCKCCIIEGTNTVINYDIISLEKIDVHSDMDMEFLGVGKRCNLLGGVINDKRVKSWEKEKAYFYKKI